MSKIDFKKTMKELYMPSKKEVSLIDVPKMNFLIIDGVGDPSSDDFQEAVGALYAITFTIKMLPKKGIVPNGYFEYVVPPLEGLWSLKDDVDFDLRKRNEWIWTLMIMQPKFVTNDLFQEVKTMVKEKKDNRMIELIRFESFKEGLCAQMMHIGPYSEEDRTIDKINKYIKENNYQIHGKHHEIYLGDPRRTKPENLKTVLRYPIKKK